MVRWVVALGLMAAISGCSEGNLSPGDDSLESQGQLPTFTVTKYWTTERCSGEPEAYHGEQEMQVSIDYHGSPQTFAAQNFTYLLHRPGTTETTPPCYQDLYGERLVLGFQPPTMCSSSKGYCPDSFGGVWSLHVTHIATGEKQVVNFEPQKV